LDSIVALPFSSFSGFSTASSMTPAKIAVASIELSISSSFSSANVSSFELSAQWTSSPFESFLSAVDVRAFNA